MCREGRLLYKLAPDEKLHRALPGFRIERRRALTQRSIDR